MQWWDERGIVVPERKGHSRIYSRDELVTVAVICQLRRRGFSLQRVRKVIRFLQQEFGTSLEATVRAASEYHLLTDGTHLYLRTSARQVVDLLKNAQQPITYLLLKDRKQNVPVWYVIYGISEKDRKGISVINATTGAFVSAGK